LGIKQIRDDFDGYGVVTTPADIISRCVKVRLNSPQIADNIFPEPSQEKRIVPAFEEDSLMVVAAVIDVIELSGPKFDLPSRHNRDSCISADAHPGCSEAAGVLFAKFASGRRDCYCGLGDYSHLTEGTRMPADPISFEDEPQSNAIRRTIAELEPRAIRTFTPTHAVLAKSAGVFHWTPEGRRLYDYSSGVLVANLGHNPRPWLNRFAEYLGWNGVIGSDGPAYVEAVPLTAYNAITEIEAQACGRLLDLMRSCPGGRRMEQVLWAASGSEAIQKALWAALHFQEQRQRDRNIILATRDGFHGKKGLAGACTGNENSPDRDPRVRFIAFPKNECVDVSHRHQPFDATPYRRELEAIWRECGERIATLITEPYLGGAGSFHPPAQYLQLLQAFCREHDVIFILDEVQSNFGRTGSLFAYETYELEPDIVVLGKGLANGAAVSAAVGRADIFSSLDYGEASDTFSANPIACAAVLATLDIFESNDIMAHTRRVSQIVERGLVRLKELPFIANVRGEGLVWGVETCDWADRSAADWAVDCVRACYVGEPDGIGIHLLGPLAGKVIRISPPLVISEKDAMESLDLIYRILSRLATLTRGPAAAPQRPAMPAAAQLA
jgi:4-aminobutyrate aminotransferase-like enzyme